MKGGKGRQRGNRNGLGKRSLEFWTAFAVARNFSLALGPYAVCRLSDVFGAVTLLSMFDVNRTLSKCHTHSGNKSLTDVRKLLRLSHCRCI